VADENEMPLAVAATICQLAHHNSNARHYVLNIPSHPANWSGSFRFPLDEISISEQWPEFWDWLPLLPPANCHSKFMQRHQEKHPLAGSQLDSHTCRWWQPLEMSWTQGKNWVIRIYGWPFSRP